MRRPFGRKTLDRFLRESIDTGTLLGLSREDGDELLVEAKRRFDVGDLDAASTLFGLHVRIFGNNSPGSADAWLGGGACLQAKGDVSRAITAYLSALDCRPDDPFARANLAECALLSNNPILARKTLADLTEVERAGLPPGLVARVESLERVADQVLDRDALSAKIPGVAFSIEPELPVDEFRNALDRSTLAERRPIDESGSIAGMLENADILVTARIDGLLVGVSRAITDFHFCTYLSDLAVDRDHQKRGIGRELIRRTHEAAGLKTTLILLAAPAAREYYPHIGMTAHDSCWIIPRTPPIEGKSQ